MKKIQRIAQFIDTQNFGGAEAVALQLSLALRSRYEVEIHHFNNPVLEGLCKANGIPTIRPPAFLSYKSGATVPLFCLRYAKVLRDRKIDLLHTHLFGPVTAGSLASVFANIPHVGTLHDEYLIAEKPSRIHLLRMAELLGTRLVTVSRSMALFFRELRKFSDHSLQTIYNGVPSPPQSTLTRSALGLKDDDLVIITVGRLVPLKRQEWLLEALQEELASGSVRLLIVGDGPLRAELEALAARLRVFPHVHFLGYRNDVAQLLPLGDIFALSSESEGLSCSILEAMAAGLPVVAMRVGGNPELVQNNVTGALATNLVDLRAALRQLIAEKDLRKAYGCAGKKRVEHDFSIHEMSQRYSMLYQEMG